MTFMVPKIFAGKTITQISRDGEKQPYTLQSVKGYDYALIPTILGNHRLVAAYAEDGKPSQP